MPETLFLEQHINIVNTVTHKAFCLSVPRQAKYMSSVFNVVYMYVYMSNNQGYCETKYTGTNGIQVVCIIVCHQ